MKTGHKTTDEWLANQAIWNDKDIICAVIFGTVIGLVIGLII